MTTLWKRWRTRKAREGVRGAALHFLAEARSHMEAGEYAKALRRAYHATGAYCRALGMIYGYDHGLDVDAAVRSAIRHEVLPPESVRAIQQIQAVRPAAVEYDRATEEDAALAIMLAVQVSTL